MLAHYTDEHVRLYHGDCIEVMRQLPDASVDAVVTDPPYGLEFMGKEWDSFAQGGGVGWKAGQLTDIQGLPDGNVFKEKGFDKLPAFRGMTDDQRNTFQSWCTEWATEALRVLKPGGIIAAFGGTRTFHRLACAIEDAGFEIRDSIAWVHGQGFPKNLNVSKALAALPTCSCGVGGSVGQGVGVVDATLPSVTVGASDGTETRTVGLAGQAAHHAVGIGLQVRAAASGRLRDVGALDFDSDGQPLPVVLGPLAVAGAAESEQVVGLVGGVKVNPETLRDEVMGQESISGPAVGANSVTLDDGGSDVRPLASLVLPLAATPSGVVSASQSVGVVGAHASAGAVDATVSPSAKLVAADNADVDAVPGAFHDPNHTPKMPVRCEECGGLRGTIPDGLGTALKPAFEPVVVARKPLIGTVAANVERYGTGALNIDGCRVQGGPSAGGSSSGRQGTRDEVGGFGYDKAAIDREMTAGRWPANVILDESQAVELDRQSGVTSSQQALMPLPKGHSFAGDTYGGDGAANGESVRGFTDTGGASRFFYTAKADSSERPRVDGVAHPTVKPLDLMRYLVRLVTPPSGVVLEPFAGSGTTLEACIVEGFRCIGIEREADYIPLIMARISKPIEPVMF